MTGGAHAQYNYNRRHSTSNHPYTIPAKHNGGLSQHPLEASPVHASHSLSSSHGRGSVSYSSGPTLSREFVVRRISEGESGRLKEELKCEACGKGYKHISSLAKHLWEHTPEWNVTKKLLISKHQQVQLLEAASILVGMNENSASRRNSVFNEDEDPKYSSPFSPLSETNMMPKEPVLSAADDSEKKKSHNTFKNAYGETYEFKSVSSNSNSRSHSVSFYPPVAEGSGSLVGSPISGGFVDKVTDEINGTSEENHVSYYKTRQLSINDPKSTVTAESTEGLQEHENSEVKENDSSTQKSYYSYNRSSDDEVVGKLE